MRPPKFPLIRRPQAWGMRRRHHGWQAAQLMALTGRQPRGWQGHGVYWVDRSHSTNRTMTGRLLGFLYPSTETLFCESTNPASDSGPVTLWHSKRPCAQLQCLRRIPWGSKPRPSTAGGQLGASRTGPKKVSVKSRAFLFGNRASGRGLARDERAWEIVTIQQRGSLVSSEK